MSGMTTTMVLNADGNLWEAIKANPDLSNFASVVKAVGYDRALASGQMFTVFAPVNDNFTSEQAQELISDYTSEKAKGVRDKENSTIKEFVQNHIALYNYSVASTSSDSIVMLNGKYKLTHRLVLWGRPHREWQPGLWQRRALHLVQARFLCAQYL